MELLTEPGVTSSSVADLEGEISIAHPRQKSYRGRTHEAALADELPKAGIRFYRPVYPVTKYYANGRKQKGWRKIFPRSLFVDSGQAGRDAADKNRRVSGYELIPPRSQTRFKLELIETERLLADPPEEYPSLKVGAKVSVTDGPFRYKEGTIETRGKFGRFTVRLELLGDSTPVELDADILEILD